MHKTPPRFCRENNGSPASRSPASRSPSERPLVDRPPEEPTFVERSPTNLHKATKYRRPSLTTSWKQPQT